MIIKYKEVSDSIDNLYIVYNFYLDTMIVQHVSKLHAINIYKSGKPNDKGYIEIPLEELKEQLKTIIKDMFSGHIMWGE